MLLQLTLNNLALVEHSELELHTGFNVITGETGAGKSLLLDALQLCVGGRTDGGLIRFGQSQTEVYAEFDIQKLPNVRQWLINQDRQVQDTSLIRRQLIQQNGNVRSKAWLNGLPISVNELKVLGNLLVNIHSQHAQQSLLRPQFVLEWLDSATGLSQQAKQVKQAFLKYEQLKNQAENAAKDEQFRQQQIQILQNKLADVELLGDLDYEKIEAEYD